MMFSLRNHIAGRFLHAIACCPVIFAVGCGSSGNGKPAGGRLKVFAGVPPLAYLAEQIGGPHITIDALIQPGQDPHTFEPTPQQIHALGQAAVFFKIDMPFESVLIDKAREGNPRLIVVDATRGVKKRPLEEPCHDSHDHDHDAHTGEPDPHVWLSPPFLKILAQNVADALCQSDPSHAAAYRKNLAGLTNRIEALHQRVSKRLASHRGRSFYVFHPGFGYLADTYGLKQKAVEVSGQSPTPKQLRELIENAQNDGVTTIFVQRQYDPQSARVVARAIGGNVVVIDGLARDVLADIEEIAEKIDAAMKETKHSGHRGKQQ